MVVIKLMDCITIKEVNKIFDNKERKKEYLERLINEANLLIDIPSTIIGLDRCIVDTWDYEISKGIIRDMFFKSTKYLHGINCKDRIDFLINDWYENNFGELDWPFSARNFDGHIARINRNLNVSEEEKDSIVAFDTIRFRRIKDINTCRNDYIESLIVYYNDNVIPTFKHNRGLDFYINGEPFDQKVSRSVGNAFIDTYGERYYRVAIKEPELVAISLYENQDEERFGYEPRLLIVYLDDIDMSNESIEESIMKTDLSEPVHIEFEYRHSNHEIVRYKTYCYVLILRK